jgi:hypothetical protein
MSMTRIVCTVRPRLARKAMNVVAHRASKRAVFFPIPRPVLMYRFMSGMDRARWSRPGPLQDKVSQWPINRHVESSLQQQVR